jgi:hypothetical protein
MVIVEICKIYADWTRLLKLNYIGCCFLQVPCRSNEIWQIKINHYKFKASSYNCPASCFLPGLQLSSCKSKSSSSEQWGLYTFGLGGEECWGNIKELLSIWLKCCSYKHLKLTGNSCVSRKRFSESMMELQFAEMFLSHLAVHWLHSVSYSLWTCLC